jgi:hypothetical protein
VRGSRQHASGPSKGCRASASSGLRGSDVDEERTTGGRQ